MAASGNRTLGPQTDGLWMASNLECKYLCANCTQIMHDCLHRGLLLDEWQDSRYDPNIQEPLQPRIILPRRAVRQRSKSIDRARPFDIRRCDCELCGIQLASTEGCGLKVAFLTLEYATYYARGSRSIHIIPRVMDDNKMSLRSSVLMSLPLDLPDYLTSSPSTLAAVFQTADFRLFLRFRQALRAARSLAVSVKKTAIFYCEYQEVWIR